MERSCGSDEPEMWIRAWLISTEKDEESTRRSVKLEGRAIRGQTHLDRQDVIVLE